MTAKLQPSTLPPQKYYKVVSCDLQSRNGGCFDWTDYAPRNGKPGRWTPVIKNVQRCRYGYHVVTIEHLRSWVPIQGTQYCRIFEVEVDARWTGDFDTNWNADADKYAFRRVRMIRECDFSDKRIYQLLLEFGDAVCELLPKSSRYKAADSYRGFISGKIKLKGEPIYNYRPAKTLSHNEYSGVYRRRVKCGIRKYDTRKLMDQHFGKPTKKYWTPMAPRQVLRALVKRLVPEVHGFEEQPTLLQVLIEMHSMMTHGSQSELTAIWREKFNAFMTGI